MSYALLDAIVSPIEPLMDNWILATVIVASVVLVVGLTIFFIKKNKKNKDETNKQ